ARDVLDRAAHRILAEQRALRPAPDLDAVHFDDAEGVHAVCRRLPYAIDVGSDARNAAHSETTLRCGGRHTAAKGDVRRYRVQLPELLDAAGCELGVSERRYRYRHLLKRFLASPCRNHDFFDGSAGPRGLLG